MRLSIAVMGFLCLACGRPQKTFSDDYVLTEFASRLEEDYHRMGKKLPPPPPRP